MEIYINIFKKSFLWGATSLLLQVSKDWVKLAILKADLCFVSWIRKVWENPPKMLRIWCLLIPGITPELVWMANWGPLFPSPTHKQDSNISWENIFLSGTVININKNARRTPPPWSLLWAHGSLSSLNSFYVCTELSI